MKKVLVIGNRIPLPARDGGALATLQILKLYARAGFQTDFVSLNTSKHFVSQEQIEAELSFLHSVETVFTDTDLRFFSLLKNLIFSSKSYNLARFYNPDFERLIVKKLSNGNYDRIHIESLYAATVLPTIKQHTKAPVFIRTHNIEHQIWERMAATDTNPFKRIYLRIMAQRLKKEEMRYLSLADKLLHIAPTDLDYFQKKLPEVSHVYLPFALSAKEEATAAEPTEFSVGFIGSMEWLPNRQGLQWFLDEVWGKVRKAVPQAVFRVAGKSMGNLFQSDKAKGIEAVGEADNALQFMQKQQLLVVPLFSGSGIRIKTLEALSVGVPVVSTSVGAQGLAVAHREHILIADSPQDFAQAVILLLTDKTQRQSLARKGKEVVLEQHNEERVMGVLG